MSVQLIIYPQSFDGTANTYATTATEFIVNGISFLNLNTASTFESSLLPPYEDTVTNAPPTILNTWYRFRTSGFTVDYPTEVSGNLVLDSINLSTVTGIYQKVSNLVVGAQYALNITLDVPTTGTIGINIFDGNNQYSGGGGAATGSLVGFSFTAQASESTVMIYYIAPAVDTATITSISLQPVLGSVTSNAIEILGDGQVICDLYEDEDLPLTLSVDDFKNVAEKVQSYSKAFNLPSTKRNSRIFDAIFEVTRSSDGVIFNPYRRTQCVLKQDGFILFEGFLRMLDVTDKEGEISYNVNLYSEVIALADILQDRFFSDLGFEELTHDYNKDNIKRSWNESPDPSIAYTNTSTSGFRDDYTTLRYPFVDWNRQWILAPTGSTSATPGNPKLPSLETAFRPFINIKYIIDRIFSDSPFTYESTFFNSTDFGKLYMDFNWGADRVGSMYNESGIGFLVSNQVATTSFTTVLTNDNDFPSNAGYSAGVFSPVNDSTFYNINYAHRVVENTATTTLDMRWKMVKSGVTSFINQVTYLLDPPNDTLYIQSGSFSEYLNVGDTLELQFKTSNLSAVTTILAGTGSNDDTIVSVSGIATSDTSLSETLRGELGQWDFLKGLITMFNLVTLPDENNPNNINIEPYADVFLNSTDSVQLDWTDKIDISQIKLTPLVDLNRKTMFKFVEDDDDSAFNQYKNQVGGHLYGSLKFDATNQFNILDGEEEIIAEPFAATVVKPLEDNFPQFVTPAIYAMNEDGSTEGFENSPRIMYNNGVKPTGASYFIPAQNGLSSENQENFLQFSHLSSIPSNSSALDFHFGECQLFPGVGTPTANNLYNLYWLPYFNELYNPNTRTMTIKVNLSPADINTFKFNDTVFIKNRVFRVNKIDYKPNDLATVEFILIP
tara:strand:- start:45 stop:2729 length:2685 start_codon:yes stop_codon:yes gene_type:complete